MEKDPQTERLPVCPLNRPAFLGAQGKPQLEDFLQACHRLGGAMLRDFGEETTHRDGLKLPPSPLLSAADSKLPRGVRGWEGAGRASDEFRKAFRGRKQPVRFPKGSNTSFSSSSTRMREWASMGPRHVLARCPCPSPPTEGNKFQAGSQLCSHSYPRTPRGWHIAGPWSVADVINTWERSP